MASEPDRAGAASAVNGAAAAPEEPASTSGRKPTVALVIGMLYAFRLLLSMPHPPDGCIQKRSREATETLCPCNAGCTSCQPVIDRIANGQAVYRIEADPEGEV